MPDAIDKECFSCLCCVFGVWMHVGKRKVTEDKAELPPSRR